jgi:single-strand DNA-binding protein
MSINRVNISGNLTRDPELRATKGGTSVLTLGVAVNDRRKNPQTGEWEDYPNFVDCTVFGKRADSLSKILSKGMKVAIEGKLHYASWEKDGHKRSKITVNVDEVEFLSQRNGAQGQGRQQANNYSTQGQNVPNSAPQQPAGQFQDEYYDESIPF